MLAPLRRVQINLFLFLWTGLLLQTNPDGITENRLLFSIVVGLLTTRRVLAYVWARVIHATLAPSSTRDRDTRADARAASAAPCSIVVFTGYLFVRELLWQLMAALREVDNEEDAEALEWDLADEAALAARGQLMSCNESDDEFAGTEDGSAHAKDGSWWAGTRAKLAAVACFTLVLGLGLGLGLRSSGGAPAHESAVTRFTLVIAQEALPGHPKELITVNGSSPGPTLRVPFGHRLEVTVINQIENDATAVRLLARTSCCACAAMLTHATRPHAGALARHDAAWHAIHGRRGGPHAVPDPEPGCCRAGH